MRRKAFARLALALSGVVALAPSGSAAAEEPEPQLVLVGSVIKVKDGDSIEVQLDSGKARVRLSAIDTPEHDQPYGDRSRAALGAMLPEGSGVEIEVVTQDSYRRLVAVVWKVVDGRRINVNETMLREGHAWAYRRYMGEARFCDLEAEARDGKRGLWAQPVTDWIYPPEWRYLKDGDIRTLPTPYAETREQCLAVLGRAGAATYTPPN